MTGRIVWLAITRLVTLLVRGKLLRGKLMRSYLVRGKLMIIDRRTFLADRIQIVRRQIVADQTGIGALFTETSRVVVCSFVLFAIEALAIDRHRHRILAGLLDRLLRAECHTGVRRGVDLCAQPRAGRGVRERARQDAGNDGVGQQLR